LPPKRFWRGCPFPSFYNQRGTAATCAGGHPPRTMAPLPTRGSGRAPAGGNDQRETCCSSPSVPGSFPAAAAAAGTKREPQQRTASREAGSAVPPQPFGDRERLPTRGSRRREDGRTDERITKGRGEAWRRARPWALCGGVPPRGRQQRAEAIPSFPGSPVPRFPGNPRDSRNPHKETKRQDDAEEQRGMGAGSFSPSAGTRDASPTRKIHMASGHSEPHHPGQRNEAPPIPADRTPRRGDRGGVSYRSDTQAGD